VQEDQELELLRCSKCKTARYCSKDCQRQHWRDGHREECKPYVSPDQAEADKVQQLLDTAVLKPEQVGGWVQAWVLVWAVLCTGGGASEIYIQGGRGTHLLTADRSRTTAALKIRLAVY